MNTIKDNQIKNFIFNGYVAPPIGFGSTGIEVKEVLTFYLVNVITAEDRAFIKRITENAPF